MQPVVSARPAVPALRNSAGQIRARRFFWFTFLFLFLCVSIGLEWDRAWHATHVFDTFYSPPHLFVYGMTVVALLLTAFMACAPGIRPWFGPGMRVPGLAFAVPGALALTLAGFGVLGLAGLLDDFWHAHFGLDETGWSTPHAMIGWGLLLLVLGFLACRFALGVGHPLPWYTALFLGWLVLATSATPFLGPLNTNKTPETVRAVANLPVLLAQPLAQHTYYIYLQWDLTRMHPLLILLGALWAGAALAFAWRLVMRPGLFLAAVALWSFLTLLADYRTARALSVLSPGLLRHPADWLPLPLLPAAVVLILGRWLGLRPRAAWALAGVVFGLGVFLVWGTEPWEALLVLLAGPAMVLGATLGERAYAMLLRLSWRTVLALLLVGLGVPFLVGLVDLYLRQATPFA